MSLRMMLGGILPFGALALIGPCGHVPTPGDAMSVAGDAAQLVEQDKPCIAMKTAPIALPEERGVGGSMAIRMVSENGGTQLKPPAGATIEQLRNADTVSLSKDTITELNRYLTTVGRLVAAGSGRSEVPWTFAVLDTPEVNAFSTPGGYVLVSRGMLQLVDSEAELAAVLAHEIAHIVHKDAIKAYDLKKYELCHAMVGVKYGANKGGDAIAGAIPPEVRDPLFAALDAARAHGGALDLDNMDGPVIKFVLNPIFDNLANTGFDRDQEFAADDLGYHLVAKAGYSPQEFEKLLGRLPKGVGMLSKHPSGPERLGKLKATLDKSDKSSFEASELASAGVILPHPKELRVLKARK